MASRTVTNLTAVLQMNNTKFKQGLTSSQKAMRVFQSQVKAIGTTIAGAFAVGSLISFGRESVQLAMKAEGIKTAFDKLNDPNLLSNLKNATRGTVSELDLMQQAVRASNFKVPLDQLATFFQFATQRSIETGESVDYLVESIINGIGRKSTLVMDNLGISAAELQAEIKKVGDFGQASANIIAREMEKAGTVLDTTAIKAAQLSARFEDIKQKTGEGLIKGVVGLGDVYNRVFNPAIWNADKALKDYIKREEESTEYVKQFGIDLEDNTKKVSDNTRSTKESFEQWQQRNDAIKEAISLEDDLSSKLAASQQKLMAELSAIGETFKGVGAGGTQIGLWDNLENGVENIAEPALDSLIAKFQESGKEIGELGRMFIGFSSNVASSLGYSIGAMEGFQKILQDLGQMIFDALGDIAIAAGLAMGLPQGLPLVVLGLGLKLGSGIIKGSSSRATAMGTPAGDRDMGSVKFEIEGQNLVGVLNRYNSNYNYRT